MRHQAGKPEHLEVSCCAFILRDAADKFVVVTCPNDEEILILRVGAVSSLKAPNLPDLCDGAFCENSLLSGSITLWVRIKHMQAREAEIPHHSKEEHEVWAHEPCAVNTNASISRPSAYIGQREVLAPEFRLIPILKNVNLSGSRQL